ncbi:hypothetical protein A3F06_03065 [candidate division TM6 bacterium RIFCSPHIGHO2_12_FULL_36_22]|nr:MAG: hypothetical protein A3F06_03065 [candidate division TM6 bacterium RIFCSPHIGHO2_12_FULL_36_22]
MKKNTMYMEPRYIVDSTGKKVEVVLDLSTYEKMVENLEDSYFGEQAERALEEGEFIDFDEANKKILKK